MGRGKLLPENCRKATSFGVAAATNSPSRISGPVHQDVVMEVPTSLKPASKESLGVSRDVGGFCSDHCLEQSKWVRRFVSCICFPTFHYVLSTVTFNTVLQTLWVHCVASSFWNYFTLEDCKGFSAVPVPTYVRRSLVAADPGQTRRWNIQLLFTAQSCSCSLTYKGVVWCRWDCASAQRVLAITETLCSHIRFPHQEVGACIPLQLREGQGVSIHVS